MHYDEQSADASELLGPWPLRQSGLVSIRTDDMETAGEMVQDLAGFLQVSDLESSANFPAEMEKFQETLTKVDEYNAVRMKLTAEMADSANLVKALIVKAEDYRRGSFLRLLKALKKDLKYFKVL